MYVCVRGKDSKRMQDKEKDSRKKKKKKKKLEGIQKGRKKKLPNQFCFFHEKIAQ